MAKQINHFYEFGSVRLDATNRLLYKDGNEISLQPRVIETLLVLVKNAQTVVDKDTLLESVWRDVVVEEGGLKRNISLLRKALGVEGQFIETLPKRGYRFAAEVKEYWEESEFYGPDDLAADLVLQRRANLRITHEEQIDDPNASHPDVATERVLSRAKTVRRLFVPVIAVLLLIAALGVLWTASKQGGSASAAPIKSIAVLPFKNLAPNKDDEHLGVGIADALITRLSSVRDLNVRPTSAVLNFNDSQQDPIAAGRALGVEAVLEGNIYRVNDRIRVTTRLLRVNNQLAVWAGQFDEKASDLLTIQSAIPQHIVTSLALNLTGIEKDALTKRNTENADAFKLYAEGRYHWNKRTDDGMRRAETLFREAIDKDPNFALAYLGLADTLSMGRDPLEPGYAIEKAIELDDKLGEAYASRGFWRAMTKWEWQAAEADFIRSIELNPGYGTAHQWYATLLAITGRVEDAKSEMRRALEIDPMSPNFLADMGQMHYFAREYEEAETYCRKALEVYPGFVFAHEYLKNIYLKKGERDKAFEESLGLQRSAVFSPTYSKSEDNILEGEAQARAVYRQSGYDGLLRNAIKQLHTQASGFSYGRFSSHAQLGEKDNALEWLEKSFENHDFMLPFANADPLFDALRPEPRFRAVFRRMGLAP
jgi:DNA-binding winged helix-turn-helix (wHTH) protein/TolB-like protein/Tfp pilus assembly protein PilF